MIIVSTNFNPIEKKFTMLINTKLVNKYFANLSGLVKKSNDLPNDITVERIDEKSALISFSAIPFENLKEDEKVKPLDDLMKTVYNFVVGAIRHEYKQTEFIPLKGYPMENMQKEIRGAVENNRRLCIIKDYDEFLNAEKTSKPIYHQYIVEPNTSEYADVVIMIYEGDLEQLNRIYKNKLKLEDWS